MSKDGDNTASHDGETSQKEGSIKKRTVTTTSKPRTGVNPEWIKWLKGLAGDAGDSAAEDMIEKVSRAMVEVVQSSIDEQEESRDQFGTMVRMTESNPA